MLKVSRLKLPVIGILVSMWLNTLTKSQIWTLLLKFFFFNDTATTEIYTLSLHDALPISHPHPGENQETRICHHPVQSLLAISFRPSDPRVPLAQRPRRGRDRKSVV